MGCFDIPGDAVLSADGRTLLLTTSDAERFANRLRVGIRTVLGTYKYDLSKGIAWFELLEKPNQALLRTAVRDWFLKHPEVRSIRRLEFRVDRQTRVLSVDYELRMLSGEVVADSTPITPLT